MKLKKFEAFGENEIIFTGKRNPRTRMETYIST